MEGIIYQNGHKVPAKLIVDMLHNLGCEDIKGNDYRRETEDCISYLQMGYDINKKILIPDFTCKYKNEEAVVEVGNISNCGLKDKINLFLNKFKYVIHIFSDDNYFLLHCILYEREVELDDTHKSFLQDQLKFIENWLKNSKEEMK